MIISGVMRRVTIILSHIRGLITLLRTTHEPPSIEYMPYFLVWKLQDSPRSAKIA